MCQLIKVIKQVPVVHSVFYSTYRMPLTFEMPLTFKIKKGVGDSFHKIHTTYILQVASKVTLILCFILCYQLYVIQIITSV